MQLAEASRRLDRIGTKTPSRSSRIAYLVVTAGAAIGGVLAARATDMADTGAVILGVTTAWVVQAVAFWMLHRALATRQRVIPIWVAGMVSRAGAIAVLWVAARAGQMSSRDLLVSYVIAILVFLVLEAAWLAIGAPAGSATPPDTA